MDAGIRRDDQPMIHAVSEWKKDSVVKSIYLEYNINRVSKGINLGCATTL